MLVGTRGIPTGTRVTDRQSARLTGKPSVYVLWAEGTSRFKIGYTKGSVDVRAMQIAAMSPLPLRIVAETAGGRRDEMALHNALRQYRVHGEWFDLPEERVWWLVGQCGIDVARERGYVSEQ